MSDRIVLHNMVFQGRHGVLEQEQRESQPSRLTSSWC
jgi:dihydroneopterin aldolase